MSGYKRILATSDLSPESMAGVQTAASLAAALDADLVLLYVVEDRLPPVFDGHRKDWADILESHRETATASLNSWVKEHLPGRRVLTEVRIGVPHEVIIESAAALDADLLVVASRGHGRAGLPLVGSTTRRILGHVPCPVVVVPEAS